MKKILYFILILLLGLFVYIFFKNGQLFSPNSSKSLSAEQLYDLKRKCREDADKFIAKEDNSHDKNNILHTYATLKNTTYSQPRVSCIISYEESFALGPGVENVDVVSFIQDIYSNEILFKWSRHFDSAKGIYIDKISNENEFNMEAQKYFFD